jgi:hypothetical protein
MFEKTEGRVLTVRLMHHGRYDAFRLRAVSGCVKRELGLSVQCESNLGRPRTADRVIDDFPCPGLATCSVYLRCMLPAAACC